MLNVFSIVRRYKRRDRIGVYKILEGLPNLDIDKFFEVQCYGITKGIRRKLKVKYSKLNSRNKNYLTW